MVAMSLAVWVIAFAQAGDARARIRVSYRRCRPAAVLDLHAVRAGTVGRAVTPIEFEELLSDRSQRKFELAAVIGTQLNGEIGDGDQQCVFVGGDELAFRQQTFDVAEECDLLGRVAHAPGGMSVEFMQSKAEVIL